ncbi:hypothetical protein DFH06DRAFT_1169799 [Mycena polygramma]|nr:hypothetical protein DFH06DRAFT_1169799 [Mycena polygramma]
MVLNEHALAQELRNLKTSCERLEHLCRTAKPPRQNIGHNWLPVRQSVFSLVTRARAGKLLGTIKQSRVVRDIELLRGRQDFKTLHFEFCKLALHGEGEGKVKVTEETTFALRDLVKHKLHQARRRVQDFKVVREHYEDGGREHLAALMRDNAKAAREKGFSEGVGSAEESQQIEDELNKIDRGLSKIGESLHENLEFWEKADRILKSMAFMTSSMQTKDPPNGITTGPSDQGIEHQAEGIQDGLRTVHEAATVHCNSKKLLKAGAGVVDEAEKLSKKCTGLVKTQASVEACLQRPDCNPKSSRKVLSPLTGGLRKIAQGYEKLSLRFFKYAANINLLFWFATLKSIDDLQADSRDVQAAQAVLLSKGFFTSSYSSYLLPFECAFTHLESQLRGLEKLWTRIELNVDGLTGWGIS